jgi:ribosome-associated protein
MLSQYSHICKSPNCTFNLHSVLEKALFPIPKFQLCYNKVVKSIGGSDLETIELARKIVNLASDKQATDILLLDTQETCNFTDYFIICSGESTRQIKAIIDNVSIELKKEGILPLHEEGTPDSGWILLDFGSIIVHIFSPLERDYYQLEKLWEKAPVRVRIP